jgi:hypothetical protein
MMGRRARWPGPEWPREGAAMALAEGPDYATRAMFLRLAAVADEAEAREAGYHRPSRGFGNNLRPVGTNVTV